MTSTSILRHVFQLFSLSFLIHESTVVAQDPAEFFESRIRPVLITHCYECHSQESASPRGGLKLDSREAVLNGGDSGASLVSGKPEESLIISAMKYDGLEMPPAGKLPDNVVADFETWIRMGAPDPRTDHPEARTPAPATNRADESFWAFQLPQKHTPPAVRQDNWVRNDIDRFILARLESAGLHPAPTADRQTLIRRMYFDMTGLPPEPSVVDRFVQDGTPDAVERMVDELLASPHYGERWARYWLDLARYAEDQAHTFKARMYPQAWLYRDWVVQALNEDMPYNQFLKLQIAGDRLDVADKHRHRAALGLFALGPVYYQDNGEQDKALADEWDDRLDVLMRGTQAITVSCARCHDHKYDPVSMKDYYGLAGIFASSEYEEVPAVPEEVVNARRQAESALKDQELRIQTFLAATAPAARLKMVSKIPDYLRAASSLVNSSNQPVDDAKINDAAKQHALNNELLKRWTMWLRNDPAFGAVGTERPWINRWQSVSAAAESSTEIDQLAREWVSAIEQLLPKRESLRTAYGDGVAFISPEDRVTVEPGVVPLGNLFDDNTGALLASAVSTDPFRSKARANGLAIHRIAQGWGKSAQIVDGVQFDFGPLGSDMRQHGEITNDGWSAEGGIRTIGQKCASNIGRTEQGIGMHANALITFDLDELRKSGQLHPSVPARFLVDRAGLNDDSLGANSSVHIAVLVSKTPNQRNVFDSVIAGYINGQPHRVTENDTVYAFADPIPEPLKSDGRFISFEVPIPEDARYLTIAVTGAQISEEENTISSDHAVLSGARIVFAVEPPPETAVASQTVEEELTPEEQRQRELDARFLSELFDERGILAMPVESIDSLLTVTESRSLKELRTTLDQKKSAVEAIQIPQAHSLTEGSIRDLNIYLAGDPKKKGPAAPRGFPAILASGSVPAVAPTSSGRMELADAIVAPSNPLTARVIVNRIWAGHFGTGIVRTLNNFGQLGDRPSHPELLDTLAVELMESGWSLKSLHRRILLSATYQQSSSNSSVSPDVDPDNRLLWKMNRRRLEVEPWRDAVLAVSGQLNRVPGGPSSELNGDHRRRTLYGYVSRHRLNDLLRLFDFPDPNLTAGERSVTTVPLQQLFVLNSDFMVGQARTLAARVQQEADTEEIQIERLFKLCFGRNPTQDERTLGREFLQYGDPQSTDRMTPLEQYCLALLGTNEFAYMD
ncbi:MAG: DUF1553 domain-containing protein [Planctomyces sp.]|nr:DUF1553 domain-containing protein [Planctomyces sp.]